MAARENDVSLFTVVAGRPEPGDLAALTVALLALAAAARVVAPLPVASAWTAPSYTPPGDWTTAPGSVSGGTHA